MKYSERPPFSAMLAKWHDGQVIHGPDFVGDALEHLYEEQVDSANYLAQLELEGNIYPGTIDDWRSTVMGLLDEIWAELEEQRLLADGQADADLVAPQPVSSCYCGYALFASNSTQEHGCPYGLEPMVRNNATGGCLCENDKPVCAITEGELFVDYGDGWYFKLGHQPGINFRQDKAIAKSVWTPPTPQPNEIDQGYTTETAHGVYLNHYNNLTKGTPNETTPITGNDVPAFRIHGCYGLHPNQTEDEIDPYF